MRYDIVGGNTFPLLKVWLEPGETLKAEAGALVALSESIVQKGKMDGGLGKAIGRMFSGETFFTQTIAAEGKPGWALLSTPAPGEIHPLELDGKTEYLVQKGGYLAGGQDVDVSTKVQGLMRGFLGGEGFFILRVAGKGTVFLSTYGAFHTLELAAGEEVKIDNGHLIAWDAAMNYSITKASKTWFSAAISGEGFACRFTGPGKILIQSRNPAALGRWLLPFIPLPRPQG